LAAFAFGLRDSIGFPLSPSEQTRLDESLALAAASLDPAEREAAKAGGAAMSLGEAMEFVMIGCVQSQE
jgi:hypothetical protein